VPAIKENIAKVAYQKDQAAVAKYPP
jgi:hypothetical protein